VLFRSPNLDGVWQVMSSTPENDLVEDYGREWERLVSGTVRANRTCIRAAKGLEVSKGTVGCLSGSEYWAGLLPKTYRLLKNRVPGLGAGVWDSVQCLDSIARSFDTAIKSGKVTVDEIVDRKGSEENGRTLVEVYGNISAVVNAGSSVESWNGRFSVDKFGDASRLLSIINYQFNSTFNTSLPIVVGSWNPVDAKVVLNGRGYWIGGGFEPPKPDMLVKPMNMSVRIGFGCVVALCASFSVGLLIWMWRMKEFRVIQASSPTFLFLVVIGANISYAGVFITILEPSALVCGLYPWFKYLGFAVVFGSLLIKTYRIEVIFNSKSRRIAAIKDAALLLRLGVYVGIWVIVLGVYVGVEALRPFVDHIDELQDDAFFVRNRVALVCEYGYWNYGMMGLVVGTLVYGCCLTYWVKDTPSAFNESRWIALSIYNWTFVGIIVQTITLKAIVDADMIFVAEVVMVVITQTGVIALMFLPKVQAVYMGNGNVLSTGFQNDSVHDSDDRIGPAKSEATIYKGVPGVKKSGIEKAKKIPVLKMVVSPPVASEERLSTAVEIGNFRGKSSLLGSAPASPKANWTME